MWHSEIIRTVAAQGSLSIKFMDNGWDQLYEFFGKAGGGNPVTYP